MKRYKEHYRTKNIKAYVSGNRKQRQYVIQASKELGMMPTTEGALDMKLTDALIESVDVFPTLCELVHLPKPESLIGASLVPQLNDPTVSGRSAVAYRPKAATIRTDTHRLIAHDDGSMELYDHTSVKKETYNLASSEPKLVSRLLALLKERLPERYREDQ